MNAAKKLALAISPLVILSVCLVFFSYWSMREIQDQIPRISAFAIESTERIQAAKTAFGLQTRYYEDAVFMDDLEAIDSAGEASDEVVAAMEELRGMEGIEGDVRREVDDFIGRLTAYTITAGEVYKEMIEDDAFLETEANALTVNSLGEAKNRLVENLNGFSEILRNELAEKIAAVNVSAKRKNDLNAVISTVVIGASVLLIFFLINRSVTRPIMETNQKLQKAMDEIWGEMELAKKIQTVLLPRHPEIQGYDIAASLDPADEVGGDYYDVITVGGHKWIVIGDVSGHGVPAGLVMMMVQTAIHTVLMENPGLPPSHLLTMINRVIYHNLQKMDESKHMTLVVLAGGADGDFTFSGLHEDILIWRTETGKVERIETDGMWIGMEPDISDLLSTDTFTLDPGDCMVLFTDGITEARGSDGAFFGDERLVRILERSGGKSVSGIHGDVMAALEGWDKPDDVTLVIVKRNDEKEGGIANG